MVNLTSIPKVDSVFDLRVIDLIGAMRGSWASPEPYPGDPYVHNTFKQYRSDLHPVVFRSADSGVENT